MESFSQVVRKADIPKNLLQYVRQDIAAGRISNVWTEVVAWDSCKLYARKQGAVVRFKKQHYGYYDCCQQERVRMEGHRTSGTFYEAPLWVLIIWGRIRKANPGIRFLEFKRPSLTRVEISLRDERGDIWAVGVHHNERDMKQVAGCWREYWAPIEVHGLDATEDEVSSAGAAFMAWRRGEMPLGGFDQAA